MENTINKTISVNILIECINKLHLDKLLLSG